MSEKLYNVGKVVNTHGIRGELKIVPQTDFPDVRFGKGSTLLLVDESKDTRVKVTVEAGRQQKNVYVVKFAGLNDIDEVEKYKGWAVKTDVPAELGADEYYYDDILGCRVITDEGEELGTITEILSPGANDVWVVSRPKGKQVLIPIIEDVLLGVDVAQKLVTIHVLEGLID